MEKHEHGGHRERMKSRYAQTGLDGMADHEILELLLYYAIPQGDTNPLAHRLINEFGSLSGVLDATLEDLMQVNGVGVHTATLLNFMPKLQRAYQTDLLKTRTVLATSEQALAYCRVLLSGLQKENFYVISLDGTNRVLNTKKICEGTIDAVSFYPRVVLETIFRSNGKRAILCHNHPSGIMKPSDLDIKATLEIKKVLDSVDIQLLDHIIVGRESAISMVQKQSVSLKMY